AASCRARWRSTLHAISMCRRPASRVSTARNSMTCPLMPRRSARPCSTPSTGSDRLMLRRGLLHGISSSAIRPRRWSPRLHMRCYAQGAGFHAYQMLEAGVRQFTVWGNTDEGRLILIAVARYLAAHSPTERAALQTADIAQRLMRGGELHQEVGSP